MRSGELPDPPGGTALSARKLLRVQRSDRIEKQLVVSHGLHPRSLGIVRGDADVPIRSWSALEELRDGVHHLVGPFVVRLCPLAR